MYLVITHISLFKLIGCSSLQDQGTPLLTICRAWFMMYSPSVYVVYDAMVGYNEELHQAIQNCQSLNILLEGLDSPHFSPNVRYCLTIIMSLKEGDEVVRDCRKTIIAMKHITDMLVKVANMELMCSLHTGLQGLMASSVTKGAAGVLFEVAGHAYFQWPGQHSYTIWHLHTTCNLRTSSQQSIHLNIA